MRRFEDGEELIDRQRDHPLLVVEIDLWQLCESNAGHSRCARSVFEAEAK